MPYFDVKRIFIVGWMIEEDKTKKKRYSEGDRKFILPSNQFANEWTTKVGEKWNEYIFIKYVAVI